MSTARVFWSGRSQAVRLPKGFRFDTDIVQIRRQGNAVVLEPVVDDWAWLEAIRDKFDQDFIEAVNSQAEQQERPELDELFK